MARNQRSGRPIRRVWQGVPVTTAATRMLDDCAETRARLAAIVERTPGAFPAAEIPEHFRRAAVLLLVGCHDGRPHLVLTERSARLRAHASEIALPGGRIDPGESAEQAAVARSDGRGRGRSRARSTCSAAMTTRGARPATTSSPLSPGTAASLTDLAPASEEAENVFLTPLAEIARPEAHRIDIAEIDGVTYENDVLEAGTFDIYGLTADLVMDLLAWLDGRERDRVPVRLEELARKLESERALEVPDAEPPRATDSNV